MINLDVEPHCHNCPEFEPVVSKLYADGAVVTSFVQCKGTGRCAAVMEYLAKTNIKEEVDHHGG